MCTTGPECRTELEPGVFHLKGYLTRDEQRALVARCRELGERTPGFYTPVARGVAKMRLEMLCLGLHWNPVTYRYEPVRGDYDQAPVPPVPDDLRRLARRVAQEVGMDLDPQVCVINYYPPAGRLGLHQDRDEQPATLAAGIPIVSLSLGDTARFLLGGLRRRDPVRSLLLASGDAFVLGGPARLRYHGVARILAGTAPPELALAGRFNLTFRQYTLASSV